jgi:hypothetical protein
MAEPQRFTEKQAIYLRLAIDQAIGRLTSISNLGAMDPDGGEAQLDAAIKELEAEKKAEVDKVKDRQ